MTTATKKQIISELARRNVIDFSIVQNRDYRPCWYHYLIGDKLKEVATGITKRLIIMVPPRHGKSELCSRNFPPWYLGYKDIAQRSIIAASYNAKLARNFGRAARNKVSSQVYYEIFNETLDRSGGTAAADWSLSNGNIYSAAGVNGGITGLGASVFLIDDPIKDRKQADSATYRENLKDWYREVALTRLTPNGAMVIIMTRWHHDDLVGWLLNEWPEEEWDILKFPAIQTEHDLTEREYDYRQPGEALWPDEFNIEKLNKLNEALGSMSFNCLYQQDPKILGGQVLNINDLLFDFELDSPDGLMERFNFERFVTSWDTAFESTKTADYSVGTVWGDTGKAYYLVDLIRGRWRFPQLKKKMAIVQEKWNADVVLIEKKASGSDLLYELRDTTDMPLIPINPKGDKVQRAAAISGRVEAGRVHVPKSAPWLREFLSEIEHFPKAKHDDQVDSFTQAIRWLTRYSGSVVEAA